MALCGLWSWGARHGLGPDGLSYLDISTAVVNGNWGALSNPYWSPLYPFLLAVGQFVTRPEPMEVAATMHLVNWLVATFAVFAFAYFLRGWMRSVKLSRVFLTFAFSLLFWAFVNMHTLLMTSPDMCAAALFFLASGMCVRLPGSGNRWGPAVALGAALGAGYYAKAALLGSGVILLVVLALFRPAGVSRRTVARAALVFLAVSFPQIAIQSWQAGRVSIGDAGRLNYAWSLNGVKSWTGWLGGPAGVGVPVHPPNVLQETPQVLEFSEPVAGTYALWYNPSYWYEGVQPRFDFTRQMRKVRWNSDAFWYRFSLAGALPLFLGLLAGYSRHLFVGWGGSVVVRPAWLALWPIGIIAMYLLVHTEPRYLTGCVVLGTLGFFQTVLGCRKSKLDAVVLAAVAAALLFPLLQEIPRKLERLSAEAGGEPIRSPHHAVAQALRDRGIAEGAKLATLGPGLDGYFARFLEARIVAQVTSPKDFWALDESGRKKICEKLRGYGVVALVANGVPNEGSQAGGWEPVAGTAFFLMDLRGTNTGGS